VSNKNSSLRIDEILLADNRVTEDQIKEALECQREHGGRLGSHLMRLGHLDEEGLLSALARQFNCETVLLADTEIPPEITSLIPSNVAVARTVIPFGYDAENNIIKIACEDPADESLISELKFVTANADVKLYIAAEMSLRTAVARHYIGVGHGAPKDTVKAPEELRFDDTGQLEIAPPRGKVLVVSDEHAADRPLRHALEQEHFELIKTQTADDAIDIIGSHAFHTAFIRDSVQGDYLDLIDRLRKVSPATRVRYYESTAQLLLSDEADTSISDLMVKSLQLFTSLLAKRDNLNDNHGSTVGQYVERLCRQIGLPSRDRLTITSAAYLHDMSRYYYGESEDAPDCRTRIPMTAKLLESLNYSPLVTEILNSMYINLRDKYTKRLPIETLGGNIITIVDIFCENVSLDTKMSLDKFETIRAKIVSLTGKLFLPEVASAFIEMIESEILIEPTSEKYSQVLMFCESNEQLEPVAQRLRTEGFRTIALQSLDRFVELYDRSRPDMIILISDARTARVISLVDELISRQIEIMKVPTFLLASQKAAPDLTPMFERGIEDIIPLENSLDLLVVKLRKLRSRVERKAKQTGNNDPGAGTSGNLADMNLIDLLQALGPSRKTARLRILASENELTLYLNHGQIIFAACGELKGAEAVYAGLGWVDGKWIVEPVADADLPEPNNENSNESILMEGCRLLDEQTRSGQEV